MITNIRLQSFRSYNDDSFEFEPGVNIIVGPNASGKTNLLEALLIASRGKSYRARDVELICHDKPWARIDVQTPQEKRVVKIERFDDAAKKSFEVDDKSYSRLVQSKTLPIVLFEPNDLFMLHGSPDQRREFLDELIEQTTPGYATLLRNYKRALVQRNKLLKENIKAHHDQMFAWDVRLSDLGSQIVAERQFMIRRINQRLSDVYSELANQDYMIEAIYSVSIPPERYASSLLKKLENNRELDFMRGFTAVGPHREDVLFEIDSNPLSATASRGETRTTMLALKIIELEIIESIRDQKPLLLLDDVFSELDGTRRKALTEFMKDHQTFITTTDADVITHSFAQHAHLITL